MNERGNMAAPSNEKPKRLILTVEMDPEDCQRLLDAFHAGKLDDLGLRDVKVMSFGKDDAAKQKWTNRRPATASRPSRKNPPER
jgi:hypothetical protein